MNMLIKSNIKTFTELQKQCKQLNKKQYGKTHGALLKKYMDLFDKMFRDIQSMYNNGKCIDENVDYYDLRDDGITAYTNINGHFQIWKYTFDNLI